MGLYEGYRERGRESLIRCLAVHCPSLSPLAWGPRYLGSGTGQEFPQMLSRYNQMFFSKHDASTLTIFHEIQKITCKSSADRTMTDVESDLVLLKPSVENTKAVFIHYAVR